MVHRPWTLSAGVLLILCAAAAAPPRKGVRACRIPVEGMVEGVMLRTIERRIEIALREEVEVIFFEIDSYGGRVDWAESIAHLIDTTTGARKVAFISNKAISAGAFIALSCDEIVMLPRATLGDCQPVIPSFQGPMQPAGEKTESAFREKMAAYARDRGYPVALTKAMVSPSMEVLRVPSLEGLEDEFVDRRDLESWSEARLRDLGIVDETDFDLDGGGPRRFSAIVDGKEMEIPVIVREGEILTLDGEKAAEYGFARHVVNDFGEAASLYGVAPEEVAVLPTLWWEGFVKLLNSMPAKALLVALGLLCFFIEFKAPGFGLPGILGVVCFALLFYAGHLAGLAQWIEIIMFGVGLILIGAEIFLIPGFGVAGIAGTILVISSLVLALVSFSPGRVPSPGFMWAELEDAAIVVFGAIGAFVVGMVVLTRYLPKTPVLGRIMHDLSMGAEAGYAARVEEGASLLGKTGISRTVLRPAGKIEVGGVIYDAAAQGDFIESGERVTIVDTSGNRIVVRKV